MPKEPKKATTARKTTTAKKTATARKPAASRVPRKKTSPSHDQIAMRAYELHLEGAGDEMANWLRAERELTV